MVDAKEQLNQLSEHDAAKRCGVSRITLLRMRKAGRIRFYRIGTRILFLRLKSKSFSRVSRKAKAVRRRETRVEAMMIDSVCLTMRVRMHSPQEMASLGFTSFASIAAWHALTQQDGGFILQISRISRGVRLQTETVKRDEPLKAHPREQFRQALVTTLIVTVVTVWF